MTDYNGSKTCSCGRQITPVEAMLVQECPACRRERHDKLMANRMVQ